MIVSAGKNIQARFAGQFGCFALDVDLKLPGRGVTIIFGGSGSGKTTFLRCVAGLEKASQGYLSVNGDVWQDDVAGIFLPTYRRSIGYVFQDAALFPHLSVHRNLAFGLNRIAASEQRVSFNQAVDLLGIRPLLDRYPDRLSGGEKQRVAMARALLTSPKLLLMDEPLASLDIPLKREILPYLERLHDELNIPMLYVTHSPDELSRLGDHLVLLSEGRVTGDGPVQSMLNRLEGLAAFAEEPGAILEARVVSHDTAEGLTLLEFTGGTLRVPLRASPPGHKLRCRVLPADVSLTLTHATDTSILNILPATVMAMDVTQDSAQVMVQLDVGGTLLRASITRFSSECLGIRAGLSLYAQIKAVAFLS